MVKCYIQPHPNSELLIIGPVLHPYYLFTHEGGCGCRRNFRTIVHMCTRVTSRKSNVEKTNLGESERTEPLCLGRRRGYTAINNRKCD